MEETNVPQDLVCELPEELALHKREHNGQLPDDLVYEPGYICSWGGRYFVHTRVVLPLKAIDNGVGFGLWVEIGQQDFERYLEAEKDDEKYMAFETKGMLANHWPGFNNLYGLIVTIKAISVAEKIYIWEIHMDKPRDPLFEVALQMQVSERDKIEEVRKMVMAVVK